MEYAVYAIHLMALVFFTVIVGGLMNHYMFQRGFAYNPRLIYPAILSVGIALYLVGGFTLWTVKGLVMALILLYASVQDISTHEADDFLWVMLVILSLVNLGDVSISSMIFGALAVFVPQTAVAMFTKKGGIGGADIKLSTAAGLSLGFYGGAIGYMLGLVFAVVFQTIYNKVKKQPNDEPFPLMPFLSAGLMIGYFI
jgi:prepilin signal peptidase PulO-like enzyme (type II secretory pathway)